MQEAAALFLWKTNQKRDIAMKTITVHASHTYPIYVQHGLLSDCGTYIRQNTKANSLAIITDDVVQKLYADAVVSNLEQAGFRVEVFAFPNGEASKCADTLLQVYNFLCEKHFTRADAIVALGGGVVGDLAGFAAATYLRGVDFIQIPTTLLAQVDSSVGGKTAIDLSNGKNLVGAFKQPVCVLCDPDTLKTLTPEIFSDGMGEVVKYGMIRDAKLFDLLAAHTQETIFDVLEDVICTCISIKRDVVEADEFESGERMILNYGHTLGHAIEGYYHYGTYSHGSAVAIGMCLIAEKTCSPEQTAALKRCLEAYHLPTSVPVPIADLLPFCGVDKKRAGDQLRYIVCETAGQAEIRKASVTDFAAWMMEGNA
jgi:3-dehydroquinate synthase